MFISQNLIISFGYVDLYSVFYYSLYYKKENVTLPEMW